MSMQPSLPQQPCPVDLQVCLLCLLLFFCVFFLSVWSLCCLCCVVLFGCVFGAVACGRDCVRVLPVVHACSRPLSIVDSTCLFLSSYPTYTPCLACKNTHAHRIARKRVGKGLAGEELHSQSTWRRLSPFLRDSSPGFLAQRLKRGVQCPLSE